MTKTVVFAVIGEPQGKGRPRFTSTGRVYTPKQTTEYETKIKAGYNKKKNRMHSQRLTGQRGNKGIFCDPQVSKQKESY